MRPPVVVGALGEVAGGLAESRVADEVTLEAATLVERAAVRLFVGRAETRAAVVGFAAVDVAVLPATGDGAGAGVPLATGEGAGAGVPLATGEGAGAGV